MRSASATSPPIGVQPRKTSTAINKVRSDRPARQARRGSHRGEMLRMRYRKLAMILAAGALVVAATGTTTAAIASAPDTTVGDTATDGTAAAGGDAASGLEAARA